MASSEKHRCGGFANQLLISLILWCRNYPIQVDYQDNLTISQIADEPLFNNVLYTRRIVTGPGSALKSNTISGLDRDAWMVQASTVRTILAATSFLNAKRLSLADRLQTYSYATSNVVNVAQILSVPGCETRCSPNLQNLLKIVGGLQAIAQKQLECQGLLLT